MTMPSRALFTRPDPHELFLHAKQAAEAMLPPDPNAWSHEVLQELYKQAPFVADYDPHVVMNKVDAEKGYGFGHIELSPKTSLRGNEPNMASADMKTVRVPVLVAQNRLKPLDLFIDSGSKTWPLTERRLRGALFRAQTFDTTDVPPKSPGLVGQLYPPHRDGHQMLGGGVTMDKTGSLLARVLPDADPADRTQFLRTVLGDEKLASHYQANRQTHNALRLIDTVPMREKRAHVQPTVVQFVKQGSDYLMRSVDASQWAPVQQRLDRGAFFKAAGEEIANVVDSTGSATVAAEDGLSEESPDQKPLVVSITEAGVYKVEDKTGRHLTGIVLPNLQDLDGELLPIALFTNGAATAVQGSIAGVHVGAAVNLPRAPEARGYGCFYKILPSGQAQAMTPMTLEASSTGPGGEQGMMGKSYNGAPITVKRQPNIARPSLSGEEGGVQVVIVPLDYRWMPLHKAEAVTLVSEPGEWRDDPLGAPDEVTLSADKSEGFNLDGPPVEKVGFDQRQGLSVNDTMFYLMALGAHAKTAQRKMAEALVKRASVRVKVARSIKLPTVTPEKIAAGAYVRRLRCDLTKEAAVLPDPTAIDTVLSLGFITDGNVSSYIAALPKIDMTQNHLCELLLAVRLGQNGVPEPALERAIKELEMVVEGLRDIAFAK